MTRYKWGLKIANFFNLRQLRTHYHYYYYYYYLFSLLPQFYTEVS